MNKLTQTALPLLIVLLFTQCTIVSGNGKVISKKIDTQEYESIVVEGSMDVELIDGKEGDITIEAEENIIELVVITVKNGVLTIDTKDGVGFSTTKGILVKVPVEHVSSVNLDGSGDIESKITLKSDTFKADLNGSGNLELDLDVETANILLDGSGNITLTGQANTLNCELDGSGNIDSFELATKEVNALLDGSGNMNLSSGEKLNADLDGSGNIQYKGNPTVVKLNNDGTGNISKL